MSVVNAIDTKRIGVGAENCADRTEGAYTGEVSAKMVASTGAQYVILGHSERRAYYHETPEILKEKVLLALANGLTPIFCIGEVLEEREAGKHFDVVKAQVEESLFNLSAEDFGKIIGFRRIESDSDDRSAGLPSRGNRRPGGGDAVIVVRQQQSKPLPSLQRGIGNDSVDLFFYCQSQRIDAGLQNFFRGGKGNYRNAAIGCFRRNSLNFAAH